MQFYPMPGLLQKTDCLGVSNTLQSVAIHGQQTVPAAQLTLDGSRRILHHEQHVDGVAGAAVTAAYDAEAQRSRDATRQLYAAWIAETPGQRLPVDPAGYEFGRSAGRLRSLENTERDAGQLGGGLERGHGLRVRQTHQTAAVH